VKKNEIRKNFKDCFFLKKTIENKQTRFAKLVPNGEKIRENSDLQFRNWLLDAVSHSQ
jgi:hypothetical protein